MFLYVYVQTIRKFKYLQHRCLFHRKLVALIKIKIIFFWRISSAWINFLAYFQAYTVVSDYK